MPVFCLDDRLLHGRHASGPRTQFLLECLADLDGALRERGGGLVVRRGPPERELAALAREAGADERALQRRRRAVRARAATSACARRSRDAGDAVAATPACSRSTTSARCAPRPASRTPCSRPSTAPGSAAPRRAVLGRAARAAAAAVGAAQGAAAVARTRSAWRRRSPSRRRGGEAAARERLAAFLRAGVRATPTTTTRWARPHLAAVALPALRLPLGRARSRSGCRAAPARRRSAASSAGATSTTTCCSTSRATRAREFQARYRGHRAGAAPAKRFEAWCEGRTGFPLVDAGMRQLRREGWMHNRARLVVGSFLTKDLGHRLALGRALVHAPADRRRRGQQQRQLAVDRLGRRRPAAGVPAHLQPGAPQERYDPDGDYVRRYVPELRDVPDEYLAEPWTMPAEVQREAGCVIGERLPGADRRPRGGPARGAGTLCRSHDLVGHTHVPGLGRHPLQPRAYRRVGLEVEAALGRDVGVGVEGDVGDGVALADEERAAVGRWRSMARARAWPPRAGPPARPPAPGASAIATQKRTTAMLGSWSYCSKNSHCRTCARS